MSSAANDHPAPDLSRAAIITAAALELLALSLRWPTEANTSPHRLQKIAHALRLAADAVAPAAGGTP